MQKDNWISNEVKILHKRHKVLDKPSVRILYEFCQFEAKKTDKILTVLRDNPNPASFIQSLIEKPQISQKTIQELQERYDKQFGVVQQTEPEDIVVPISASFDFFAGVVGYCMITVMSYLDPYSFSSFAVCSSSIYKVSRSEAHSEYYRRMCMFLFDRQVPAVPAVCRFHRILGHALQNPLQYGPNALHGMTSDLRKHVWRCDLEEFRAEKSYFSSFKSYERLFKECPRVHLNGLYVCKHKYVRIGQKDKHNPFTPIHVIHYYRYLRFFEDGSVLYEVSNRKLRAEQLEQRLGLARLSQDCIMGEYRQCRSRLAVKTVKANEVFSYEFAIEGNSLSVMSYQLELMDSSEIKQTLFKSDPNKESLVFTYYHCRSMAQENSGRVQSCSK